MINRILNYNPPSNLWDGEYKIPWNEKRFSERMLKMHLSQDHDIASRREKLIEKQIKWIHDKILQHKHSRILDIGCGPGLYVNKLTSLGHDCTGIDFSPASIEYARRNFTKASFILKDIREADYGKDFDLTMLLFGEINVFSPKECKLIVKKMYDSLKPGGEAIIEAYLFNAVKKIGETPKSWFRSSGNSTNYKNWFDNVMDEGLFSDKPHIALVENNWLEAEKISISNFWILEDDDNMFHYVSTTQAYTDQEYITLLKESNFKNIKMCYNFGEPLIDESNYQVIVANK